MPVYLNDLKALDTNPHERMLLVCQSVIAIPAAWRCRGGARVVRIREAPITLTKPSAQRHAITSDFQP